MKETTILIAGEFGLSVVLVTNYAHYSTKPYPDYVSIIYVDMGSDMADYKIASTIQEDDVLITQDYGLASIVLFKARVLHQSGKEFTAFNIDRLLAKRAESSKMRRSGKHTKGPKAYTEEDRQAFITSLRKVIEESSTA